MPILDKEWGVILCFGCGPSPQHHQMSLAKSLTPMDLKVSDFGDSYGAADMACSDPSLLWPPPDPDRMPRSKLRLVDSSAFIRSTTMESNQDRVDAFRQRQRQDMNRLSHKSPSTVHGRTYRAHRSDDNEAPEAVGHELAESSALPINEKGWRDSEGDRLDDFGVDEDVEFYDEDEVPLAELLHGKITQSSDR